MQISLRIASSYSVSLSDSSHDRKNDGVLLLPVFLKPFLDIPSLSVPIEDHVFQQLSTSTCTNVALSIKRTLHAIAFHRLSLITRQRVYSGNSSLDGYFCTLSNLSTSSKYRVEIYDPGDSHCVLAAWNISYQTNPTLWADNCGGTASLGFHLGQCANIPSTSQCWGD